MVFGTRSEVVRLAYVVKGLGPSAESILTGQYWDDEPISPLLNAFGLGRPSIDLGFGDLASGEQLGPVVESLTRLFTERRPDAVVVLGDSTSALAGALAARDCGVPLVQAQAGVRESVGPIRSQDPGVMVDHMADRCLVPTARTRDVLLAEGIPPERVVVAGDLVCEAIDHLLPPADLRRPMLRPFGITPSRFVLAAFERPESAHVDSLHAVLGVLRRIASAGWPVVLPLHPRSRRRVEALQTFPVLGGLKVTKPLAYPTLLALAAQAGLLVSDSPSLSSEAAYLGRPIAVVRGSTERVQASGSFSAAVQSGAGVVAAAIAALQQAEEGRTLPQDPGAAPAAPGAARRCLDVINEVCGVGAAAGAGGLP